MVPVYTFTLRSNPQHQESTNKIIIKPKTTMITDLNPYYRAEQLTQEEISQLVSESIKLLNITSQKEIGKLMSDIMPKLKGKASGKEINKIAMQILNTKL